MLTNNKQKCNCLTYLTRLLYTRHVLKSFLFPNLVEQYFINGKVFKLWSVTFKSNYWIVDFTCTAFLMKNYILILTISIIAKVCLNFEGCKNTPNIKLVQTCHCSNWVNWFENWIEFYETSNTNMRETFQNPWSDPSENCQNVLISILEWHHFVLVFIFSSIADLRTNMERWVKMAPCIKVI